MSKINKAVAEVIVRLAASSLRNAADKIDALIKETGESGHLHSAHGYVRDALQELDKWAIDNEVEIRKWMKT